MKKRTKLFVNGVLMMANSFAICLSVSFAWFKNDRGQVIDADHLELFDSSLIESVNFYKCVDTNVGYVPTIDGEYLFNTFPAADNDMGRYSIVGSNYQVLVEAVLTDYGKQYTGNITLEAHSTATVFLGETENDQLKIPLEKTGNSISSIISFYAFDPSNVSIVNDHYVVKKEEAANITSNNKFNFVDNYLLIPEIPLCDFTPATSNVDSIFIMLDYDLDLIEYIYSANLGNPNISDVTDVGDDGNSYISYTMDFCFFLNVNSINVPSGEAL